MKIKLHSLLEALLRAIKGKIVKIGPIEVELDKSKGADAFGSDRTNR